MEGDFLTIRHYLNLIENRPEMGIDNPTTERLVKGFDEIYLSIVHLQGQLVRHVTRLSASQSRVLELLGSS